MSEKIVQLNEEVIKGQIKELVRGRKRILKFSLIIGGRYSTIFTVLFLCFGAEQGRTSWGDSGALYPQSATAGMNPGPRTYNVPSALDKQ